MIKVILCNTIDEYVEYERVAGAKDSCLIDFFKDDKCSIDDAMNALKILKKNKVFISDAEKTAIVKEIHSKHTKTWLNEICCERCGASVDSSEELTSMPILMDYNNNKDVSDQLGTLDICPNCLLEITNRCNSPF